MLTMATVFYQWHKATTIAGRIEDFVTPITAAGKGPDNRATQKPQTTD